MPFAESLASTLAGRAIGAAASAITKEAPMAIDFLVPDDVYNLLHDVDDDELPTIVVSERQRVNLETFLERPEVTQLLQAWCHLRVSNLDERGASELSENIQSTFEQVVRKWNLEHRQEWSSLAPDLWLLLTKTLDAAIPRLRVAVNEETSLQLANENFTLAARMLRGLRGSSGLGFERIVTFLGQPRRILAVPELVRRVKHVSARRYYELQLGHAQDVEDRIESSLLYVDRVVVDTNSRESSRPLVKTIDLIDSDRVSKAVIVGDPGVGKSTFVRHVMFTLAQRDDACLAPILINCRDYASSGWSKSITEFISASLRAEFTLDTRDDAVDDLLTAGAACVVFDGVDELIDLKLRREIIRRIESFTTAYPFVTVLCSTRKVGFSQAKFDSTFKLLELTEFSYDEFKQYVTRWFALTNRSDGEREAFLRESVDVKDIRQNPLMVSLLCTLYRARGHIPRNRRQVYRDCADLLFQRWDAMRHVPQPFDHRQYGNRLMQELARFYYTSQSAQSGVEEGQLIKIIAHFFRDTASIDPPNDEDRARQFLDFCAGRAWLLSRSGTNERGVRLFSFTHRTFMEFMAAEAMVRNAQDVGSIAGQIQEVFYADPSSVIPDVMAQAVEDKFDRGAEKTLQILVDSGKAKTGAFADKLLALCLRIVNAAPMSRAVALGLPGLVMSYWSRVDFVDDTRDSSMALFGLYRDPRDRLLAAAKGEIPIKWKSEEFGASALNRALVKRWARISLLGRAELFDEEWASALRDQVLTGKIKDDYVVLDYLASLGLATTSTNSRRGVRPALLLNVFGERVPGSAIRALFAAFAQSGDMKAHERKILQTFKAGLPSARPDVQPAEAIAISRMLRNASSRLSVYCDEHIESILGAEPAVRAILWWLLAMTFEISPDNPFLQAFGRTSSLFSRIAQIREEEQEYQFSSSYRPLSLEQLRKSRVKMASADEWPKGVGPWFELWTRGALALVKSDREDVLTKALSMKPDEFVSPVVRERWRDFVEDIQRDKSNLY